MMNKAKVLRAIRLKRRQLDMKSSEIATHLSITESEYLAFENHRFEISKDQFNLLFEYLHMTEDDLGIGTPVMKETPTSLLDAFRITKVPGLVIEKPKLTIRKHETRRTHVSIPQKVLRERLEHEMFHPEHVTEVKPMLYASVFISLLLLFIVSAAVEQYALSNLVLSAIIPVSLLVFMHEITVPKQIKGTDVIRFFLFGGMTSILVVYAFRTFVGYPEIYFVGDVLTGIVEEVAKIIVVIFILRRFKVKDVMIGILIGFAVGAGFDVFETSDYGMYAFLETGGDTYEMLAEILFRSIYALFGIGHHFWTALIAGALVLVNKDGRVAPKDFIKPIALVMTVVVVMTHALWNFTVTHFAYAKFAVIVFSSLLFFRFVYVQFVNAQIRLTLAKIERQKQEESMNAAQDIQDSAPAEDMIFEEQKDSEIS